MIINLISGPRNVSTALMYSFAQRNDTQVIDEPFYGRYLKKSGVDHPGKDTILCAQPTNTNDIISGLEIHNFDESVIFIKNMAHHLQYVSRETLRGMHNIFLIRNPQDVLLSLIETLPDPNLRDTACQAQYELFHYVNNHLKKSPIVIDASELLKNPSCVLEQVCNRLEIPFDEGMLQWEAGPIPQDGVWAEHWYDSVHKSTGFEPYEPKEEPVPAQLQPLLAECRNYYEKLFQFAIKAPVNSQ